MVLNLCFSPFTKRKADATSTKWLLLIPLYKHPSSLHTLLSFLLFCIPDAYKLFVLSHVPKNQSEIKCAVIGGGGGGGDILYFRRIMQSFLRNLLK